MQKNVLLIQVDFTLLFKFLLLTQSIQQIYLEFRVIIYHRIYLPMKRIWKELLYWCLKWEQVEHVLKLSHYSKYLYFHSLRMENIYHLDLEQVLYVYGLWVNTYSKILSKYLIQSECNQIFGQTILYF